MLVSRDIARAAELIDQYGWKRSGGGSCNVGFCINDALAKVTRQNNKRHAKALEAISDAIEDAGTINPNPFRRVTMFNDWRAQDKQEVLDVLAKAARKR